MSFSNFSSNYIPEFQRYGAKNLDQFSRYILEWEKLPRASIFKSWSSVDILINSKYNTWINSRLEECSPGGCFMELCLQLGLVFFFKQIILSGKEYYLPQLWRWYKNPHSRLDKKYNCVYPILINVSVQSSRF